MDLGGFSSTPAESLENPHQRWRARLVSHARQCSGLLSVSLGSPATFHNTSAGFLLAPLTARHHATAIFAVLAIAMRSTSRGDDEGSSTIQAFSEFPLVYKLRQLQPHPA